MTVRLPLQLQGVLLSLWVLIWREVVSGFPPEEALTLNKKTDNVVKTKQRQISL